MTNTPAAGSGSGAETGTDTGTDTGKTGRRRTAYGTAVVALLLAAVLMTSNVPSPLYALHRQHDHFSRLMVTVVFAVYAVGVVAALQVTGRWSDRLGRRAVLLPAAGIALAAMALLAASPTLPALLTARVLSGIAVGMTTQAAAAALLDLATAHGGDPERASRYGALLTSVVTNASLGLGAVFAGAIAEPSTGEQQLRLPYLAALPLVAVPAIGLCWARLAGRAPGRVGLPALLRELLRPTGFALPRARAAFAGACAAAAGSFAYTGLLSSVASSLLAERLGSRDVLVAGAVVCAPYAFGAAAQIAARHKPARTAAMLGLLLVPGGLVLTVLGLGVRSLAVVVAAQVVGGCGAGLALRGGQAMVSATAEPAERGRVLALYFLAAYMGLSLPVLGFGLLETVLSAMGATLVFAVVVAAGETLGFLLLRRGTPAPPYPGSAGR